MTIPADSLSSDSKQGKLRPLTSLPMPMLPTEQQLKGTAHQLPQPPRSRGPPQNSLLSSWLSHANSGNNNVNNNNINNHNSSRNGFSEVTRNTSRSTLESDQDNGHSSAATNRLWTEHHAQRKGHHVIEEGGMNHEYPVENIDNGERQRQHTTDAEHSDQSYTSASPISATTLTPLSPQSLDHTTPTNPEKRKRGRKPKPKTEQAEDENSEPEPIPIKDKKPKVPKDPKPPKEKKIKDPKPTKELKTKKSKKDPSDEISGTTSTVKSDRTILSFFDRSVSTPSSKPAGVTQAEENRNDNNVSSPTSPKASFKQSCLSFDVLDPSKTEGYYNSMAAASRDEDKRFGGLMRELPKLTGRAPYEDLLSGMLMRSSKLPNLTKLNLHHPELDMDMLADVKMVHEFLNTFGTPLGLTKDSGEWITLDLLLSMIRNPRIDSRLLELNCNMVMAAYDEEKSPKINQYNFPYFLAVGPDARSTLEERKEDKKNKHSGSSRTKVVPMNRLGTLEYSVYTIADRIEALVKALHDIMSSDRFHRFMRDEVEENITALKRQKRKRAEVRKELETQTHDLEREMKAIEREAAELESRRQSILTSERESGLAEDESGITRITATSRLQRLAQSKEARTKANELLNRQKTLANDLKSKESSWESKKDELEEISLDDTEVQKDHNVPLTQLRGGHVVNSDEKLRVICLGSDRWGRKYWFWKEFGGVIVEDRAQVGPKRTEDEHDTQESAKSSKSGEMAATPDAPRDTIDDSLNDVTQRMKTMAQPELSGDRFQSTRDSMSINDLSSDKGPTYEGHPITSQLHKFEKDLLDYGPIQTWSLISTSKELGSVTRALNAKGTRERILKASLIAMRKDIEESFHRIKAWAGNEYKNDHTISVMGAVGQPLSEEDLILLKKKRGRKSRQELADIAATQIELAAAGDESQVMDLDNIHPSEHPTLSNSIQLQDMDMDYEGSDHEQYTHERDDMVPEKAEIIGGLFATTQSPDSGPLPSEFLENIIQAAEEKLRDLSRIICGGEAEAILAAIKKVQETHNGQDDLLHSTVKTLAQCLYLMDEPILEGDEAHENRGDIKAENTLGHERSVRTKTEGIVDTDVAMTEAEVFSHAEIPGKLSALVPVVVNPRLFSWLKNCRLDAILEDVKTYGALHAWLDECIDAIESVVYDTDSEGEQARSILKKTHDDEAEDDDGDGEDEGDEEDEHDHEDEERDNLGDEHGGDDGDVDEGHGDRQIKTRKETRLRTTTIRGRALRARNNKPVSYKYDFGINEEEDDEDDDDDEEDDPKQSEGESEEEGVAFRLRRSKRTRH
ncbi:hypothetical protein BGZ46_002464 [Entomortierella lignicola]|nr:hypothetical protein BGZ46_002464 [Entomortierella lignicola]